MSRIRPPVIFFAVAGLMVALSVGLIVTSRLAGPTEATAQGPIATFQSSVPTRVIADTPKAAPSAPFTSTIYTQLHVLPTQPPLQTALPTATPTRRPPVVRLQIPVIKLDAKVVEMGWHFEVIKGAEQVIWDDPANAVGHVTGAGNPGDGKNIVFSGHNNIEGSVFLNLWKVKVGDDILVTTAEGADFKYRVTLAQIVAEKYASPEQRAANARAMEVTPPERITVISCYPPTNNTYRVIVVASPEP